MNNEIIFLSYTITICIAIMGSLLISKEALVSVICIQALLVNLFVSKEITLFGFTATASDALAVGGALALNLVQEFFGKKAAQHTILLSFLCSLFYVLLTKFHLAYLPAPVDTSSLHFEALLNPMPRVVIASLIIYLLVQYLDCQLYGRFCTMFAHRYFIFRNFSSIAITQLLDTILFAFFGLYKLNEGFSSINVIFQIICVSYGIKIITLSIAAPFLSLTRLLSRNRNH